MLRKEPRNICLFGLSSLVFIILLFGCKSSTQNKGYNYHFNLSFSIIDTIKEGNEDIIFGLLRVENNKGKFYAMPCCDTIFFPGTFGYYCKESEWQTSWIDACSRSDMTNVADTSFTIILGKPKCSCDSILLNFPIYTDSNSIEYLLVYGINELGISLLKYEEALYQN
jgi:hypothetical protein